MRRTRIKRRNDSFPQKQGFFQEKLLTIIGMCLLISMFAIFGAFAYIYKTSDEKQEGFFVCDTEDKICELSQHIHADIDMRICGQDITFSKEKGHTDRQHTHKERNKIHWHSRIQVDSKTREPLDATPLTIASFLEEMDYTLPASCTYNNNPKLTVQVNDALVEKGLKYVWKDGDGINVAYD